MAREWVAICGPWGSFFIQLNKNLNPLAKNVSHAELWDGRKISFQTNVFSIPIFHTKKSVGPNQVIFYLSLGIPSPASTA